MTGPQGSGASTASAMNRKGNTGCVVGVICLIVMIFLGIVSGASSCSADDSGTDNGLPLPADADTLATDLADATEAQGICYGWDLSVDNAGIPNHGVGSNRGAGQAVDEASCRRWVVFDADVTWTSESSEAADTATYQLRASDDLTDQLPSPSDLTDVGVTDDTLINNPGGSTITVLESLPLLLAERGAAKPLPGETGEPTGDVSAPPNAGSDRWRANKAFAIFAVVLLLAAGALVFWGFRRRSRPAGPDDSNDSGPRNGPPPPPNRRPGRQYGRPPSARPNQQRQTGSARPGGGRPPASTPPPATPPGAAPPAGTSPTPMPPPGPAQPGSPAQPGPAQPGSPAQPGGTPPPVSPGGSTPPPIPPGGGAPAPRPPAGPPPGGPPPAGGNPPAVGQPPRTERPVPPAPGPAPGFGPHPPAPGAPPSWPGPGPAGPPAPRPGPPPPLPPQRKDPE